LVLIRWPRQTNNPTAKCKPSPAGIWQISGRNRISFEQWMKLDMQYIDNWSLWLDFKILARTIPAVLMGLGAK
jgi:lipopolysaccharide/colanic/teichoic acid biosynthesis glycosyltransferase